MIPFSLFVLIAQVKKERQARASQQVERVI